MNKWLTVFALVLAAAACVNTPSNSPGCSPNFSPGDRFKVTINSIFPEQTPCRDMPLYPGDSFVVTANSYKLYDVSGRSHCYTYTAVADGVPDFAKGVMKSCASGSQQLGISCNGVTNDGCEVGMVTQIGEVPSESQGVIEHSVFEFHAGGGRQVDGGASCSMSWECAINQFDARIERLPPGSDGG
jgi:hypothetical protein